MRQGPIAKLQRGIRHAQFLQLSPAIAAAIVTGSSGFGKALEEVPAQSI